MTQFLKKFDESDRKDTQKLIDEIVRLQITESALKSNAEIDKFKIIQMNEKIADLMRRLNHFELIDSLDDRQSNNSFHIKIETTHFINTDEKVKTHLQSI